MDLKKILTIFIYLFFGINVFLIFQLTENKQDNQAQITPNTLVTNMRDDNIEFNKLQTEQLTGYYLGGNINLKNWATNNKIEKLDKINVTLDDSKKQLKGRLKQPVLLVNDDNKRKTQLRKIIYQNNYVLHAKQYIYNDKLTEQANLGGTSTTYVVYQQKLANDQSVGSDGKLTLEINHAGELVGYTQTYIEHVQKLRDPAALISEQMAVATLYQYNEIPNNTKILWTKLGYSSLMYVDDSVVLVPTWLVQIKNGNNYNLLRINALDGKLMDQAK